MDFVILHLKWYQRYRSALLLPIRWYIITIGTIYVSIIVCIGKFENDRIRDVEEFLYSFLLKSLRYANIICSWLKTNLISSYYFHIWIYRIHVQCTCKIYTPDWCSIDYWTQYRVEHRVETLIVRPLSNSLLLLNSSFDFIGAV